MKIRRTIAAAVAGCALVPVMASAAVIGGTNYASQYDYGEFFSIADHHDFKVVLAGNPDRAAIGLGHHQHDLDARMLLSAHPMSITSSLKILLLALREARLSTWKYANGMDW